MSLRNAITIALQDGGAPMSPNRPQGARTIEQCYLNASGIEKKQNTLDILLSEREKEIADALFISIFIVRKHIAHIYEKLHVSNTTQVMSLSYKNGWIK